MIRAANLVKGSRVVTPSGEIARVESVSLNTADDIFSRVVVKYLDEALETVTLQAKLLKPYLGPPVLFPDERESIRMRHGDKPLSIDKAANA